MAELELAKQFFDIANAITAFSLLQTVALLYAFLKEPRLTAALLRWRPLSSALSKWTVNSYTGGIIVCGAAEFWLRYAASQRGALLGACVIAILLRCSAIYFASLVYRRIFVAMCREEDWRNKNKKDENEESPELQIPRLEFERVGIEKWLYKRAKKIDKKLFEATYEKEIKVKDFSNIYKGEIESDK